MLANFLRTLEFIPSRFDRDAWTRMRGTCDGYNYICTYIDNFKVVSKNPQILVDSIASVFLVKEHDPRNYYLSNAYTCHETQDMWTYGYKTYATDDGTCVERQFVYLSKFSTPMTFTDCHP